MQFKQANTRQGTNKQQTLNKKQNNCEKKRLRKSICKMVWETPISGMKTFCQAKLT